MLPQRSGEMRVRPAVGPLARGRRDEAKTAPSLGPTQLAMVRLREDMIFKTSVVIFVMVVVMCAAAPVFERGWAHRTATEQNLSGKLGKHDVVKLDGTPGIGPGLHRQYMLGSDELGRDVFMRTLRGGKVSLQAGFGAATLAMLGAVILGTMAGFKRGWWDAAISRYFDFMMSFPMLILMVALSTALATRSIGPIHRGSVGLLILIMGVGGVAGMGRMIRALVVSLAEKDFVEAARALGSTDSRIMFRHMLPNISNALVTYYGLMVSGMIIGEAGLSYLGIGILPPGMSWGSELGAGLPYYLTAPWMALVPGFFIVLTTTSVNLIGQSIEKAFDPKNLGGR